MASVEGLMSEGLLKENDLWDFTVKYRVIYGIRIRTFKRTIFFLDFDLLRWSFCGIARCCVVGVHACCPMCACVQTASSPSRHGTRVLLCSVLVPILFPWLPKPGCILCATTRKRIFPNSTRAHTHHTRAEAARERVDSAVHMHVGIFWPLLSPTLTVAAIAATPRVEYAQTPRHGDGPTAALPHRRPEDILDCDAFHCLYPGPMCPLPKA